MSSELERCLSRKSTDTETKCTLDYNASSELPKHALNPEKTIKHRTTIGKRHKTRNATKSSKQQQQIAKKNRKITEAQTNRKYKNIAPSFGTRSSQCPVMCNCRVSGQVCDNFSSQSTCVDVSSLCAHQCEGSVHSTRRRPHSLLSARARGDSFCPHQRMPGDCSTARLELSQLDVFNVSLFPQGMRAL